MDSRSKGKRGELEAAAELRRLFGRHARRGQQFAGTPDSPDVVWLPDVHVEVKRTEKGSVYKWIAQAISDAGSNLPMVLHRRSHAPWLAIVRLDDLPRLVRLLRSLKDEEG